MAEGGGEIREGFLCPVCMFDCESDLHLRIHFKKHAEESDFRNPLKDLLGKAKKKILKLDEGTVSCNYEDVEPQDIGATRSCTESFRNFRRNKLERCTVMTNKLLIRLGKLLEKLPEDPGKRKAYEQGVVQWIDDKDVKQCPTCHKNFHVARRKHHCRLCGAIMCHDCSQFLPLTLAKKINSTFGHPDGASSRTGSTTNFPPSATTSPPSSVGHLHRSNSNSSLNSVLSLVDTMTGEQHFRLCIPCEQLLDMREKMMENQMLKPIINQFYERLKSYQAEADQVADTYSNMCLSLNSGESTYNLTDAQVLRVKLLQLAENIDSLSNKIAILGTKDVENPPRGQTLQLQQMIRTAATNYLKTQLVELPTLPTESEFKALRDQRREDVSVRIQREKQLAAQTAQQVEIQWKRDSSQHRDADFNSSLSQHKSADQVTADMGWGPKIVPMYDLKDPLAQQISNICNYIQQARSAQKHDEAETLEQNLTELREEYYRQQLKNGPASQT